MQLKARAGNCFFQASIRGTASREATVKSSSKSSPSVNAASNGGLAEALALAARFAFTMKVETKLARNASFDAEFEWLGRSGVELARYVIAQEGLVPGGGQVDSLNQKWAGGPGASDASLGV